MINVGETSRRKMDVEAGREGIAEGTRGSAPLQRTLKKPCQLSREPERPNPPM